MSYISKKMSRRRRRWRRRRLRKACRNICRSFIPMSIALGRYVHIETHFKIYTVWHPLSHESFVLFSMFRQKNCFGWPLMSWNRFWCVRTFPKRWQCYWWHGALSQHSWKSRKRRKLAVAFARMERRDRWVAGKGRGCWEGSTAVEVEGGEGLPVPWHWLLPESRKVLSYNRQKRIWLGDNGSSPQPQAGVKFGFLWSERNLVNNFAHLSKQNWQNLGPWHDDKHRNLQFL